MQFETTSIPFGLMSTKTGSKLNLLGYITSFGKYRPCETDQIYAVTSVTDVEKELAQYYTFRRDTIAQKDENAVGNDNN
jgi:hypothetical protein